MKKTEFNKGWTYRCLEETGSGQSVTLPHDAMLSENRTQDSAGGINTGWFEGHDYLYEKTFFVSEEDCGKAIGFEFEGVYHNAEVYINSEKVAYRPYGYSNFYADASAYLKYGEENTIMVIARNADQPNSRWYSGAGIYRPVWMYTAPEAHIKRNGIRIRTVEIAPAVIETEIYTTGTGKLEIEIRDEETGLPAAWTDTETEGRVTVQIEIQNGKLWSADCPNLYRLRVSFLGEGQIEEDVDEQIFGIRMIDWDPENGFCINKERVILRGACIHHDNGVLGACCYPEAEARKVRILKENGDNALRSAHNPCSKALLEACDRQGMLVMDEFVDVWYIHKTEYDYVNYFQDWWKQDLQDMVEKDYNHPSVIMYSTGNEVSETAQKRGILLTKELTEYLHSLDATRPVICGINIFFNFLSSVGFGVYSDKKGGVG